MAPLQPLNAATYGLSTNQNNGQYRQGQKYSLEKKLEVSECYLRLKGESNGHRPSLTAVAKECHVGWSCVQKVEQELQQNGRIVPPEEIKALHPIGPGAKTIDDVDAAILLRLRELEPSRSLSSYKEELELATGSVVSKTTISNFFNHAFPIKGSLRKPNLIPLDKFKPINMERAEEYLDIVKHIHPSRLKFADEKLLKGSEVYNRKTRRNVLTGEVPPVTTDSDFRNTYSITGICSIDEAHPVALWHQVHDDKNDAESFSLCVETAVAARFLKRGDVLVIDNAKIHTYGDNEGFAEWLWVSYGILLLLLPTRSPELNPIELVWRTLCQRLRYYPMNLLRRHQDHASAKVACEIMQQMTHKDVANTFGLVNLI